MWRRRARQKAVMIDAGAEIVAERGVTSPPSAIAIPAASDATHQLRRTFLFRPRKPAVAAPRTSRRDLELQMRIKP
jgi:hypothetical protein